MCNVYYHGTLEFAFDRAPVCNGQQEDNDRTAAAVQLSQVSGGNCDSNWNGNNRSFKKHLFVAYLRRLLKRSLEKKLKKSPESCEDDNRDSGGGSSQHTTPTKMTDVPAV